MNTYFFFAFSSFYILTIVIFEINKNNLLWTPLCLLITIDIDLISNGKFKFEKYYKICMLRKKRVVNVIPIRAITYI